MKIVCCPFCGREEPQVYRWCGINSYTCERCDASGPATYKGKEYALELWNKRAVTREDTLDEKKYPYKDPSCLVEALRIIASKDHASWCFSTHDYRCSGVKCFVGIANEALAIFKEQK